MSTKQQRLAIANSFLRVMGRHGRRFFYNKEHDRYAELQLCQSCGFAPGGKSA